MKNNGRIHESVAVAALVAAGWTLQVAWISNFLMAKSEELHRLFDVVPSIGPIAGLYLSSLVAGVVVFFGTALWLRGKDCQPYRQQTLAFFFISVILFSVMTLPIVYGLSLGVTRS